MTGSTRRVESPTGKDGTYRACGKCSRCVSGTGRDRDPGASDCWDDYLEAAARGLAGRRPA
ncbi:MULTISPECIES: hypothetical protein [unclassified Kitasatospora]|uniref:hypothetical protein n=1 Tax=unclassified Kitasatospora TaxID=2633591 RepID=UPI003822F58F